MSQIVPKLRLRRWAQEKFRGQRSTMELMGSSEDPADKAVIAIVALLEVDPEIRYLGMGADEAQYVKSCHTYLSWLKMEWKVGYGTCVAPAA